MDILNTNENELKGIYSNIGYPVYTQIISDMASVYIKNGHTIKNRGDRNIIRKEWIDNFRNIVIEDNGNIDIYCSEEKSRLYIREIKNLKKIYNNIDKHINIHIGRER